MEEVKKEEKKVPVVKTPPNRTKRRKKKVATHAIKLKQIAILEGHTKPNNRDKMAEKSKKINRRK